MTLIAGMANLWKLSTEGITWETAGHGRQFKIFILWGKKEYLEAVRGSCCNTSGGDQFCLRYGLHVVYKMEGICQQGCNEFCKTWLLVQWAYVYKGNQGLTC